MALATFTLCQTPCWVGIRPVINDARDGQQCGDGQQESCEIVLRLTGEIDRSADSEVYCGPYSRWHVRRLESRKYICIIAR